MHTVTGQLVQHFEAVSAHSTRYLTTIVQHNLLLTHKLKGTVSTPEHAPGVRLRVACLVAAWLLVKEIREIVRFRSKSLDSSCNAFRDTGEVPQTKAFFKSTLKHFNSHYGASPISLLRRGLDILDHHTFRYG